MENLVTLLKENSPVKYDKFLFIIDQAKDILPKIRTSFPEFNNHDVKHAEGVVKKLDEIIPDDIKTKLTDEEIFCLLCSAWLHDIGMVPSKSEELEFEKDDIALKNDLRAEIRDKHHIRSYNFIKKEDSFKLDTHEKNIIAYISRAHRQINIYEDLDEKYRISSTRGEVHLQFLGALLRIADECDITLDRVSKHYIEESRSTPVFFQHIKKHELIDDVYLDKSCKNIIIRGNVSSDKEMNIIKRSQKDIEEEINEVKDILEDNDFYLNSVCLAIDKDIWIEKEIILLLSKCKALNLAKIHSELKSEVNANKNDIERNLENLVAKKIVNIKVDGKYVLSNDIDIFKDILELYYEDDKLKSFIDYPYSAKIIKEKLFNHLMQLYNCIMDETDEINKRIEILKNSPTAISLSLRGKDLFDPDLNQRLFQGKYLLDLLIMLGFHYDMYKYPMKINDMDKYITDFLNPMCSQICKELPKLIEFYNEAQKNAERDYSEKLIDIASEKGDKDYSFSMEVTSKKGGPDFNDMLLASQKTGYPLEITGDRISNFKLKEKGKENDIGKVTGIKLVPNSFNLLNLKVTDTDVGFNDLKFITIKDGNITKISTETRNLPYTFEFIIDDEDVENLKVSGSFTINVDSNANVAHLLKFEEFLRALNEKRSFVLINPITKKPIATPSNLDFELTLNDGFYEILKKLTYIQRKSGKEIKIPEGHIFTEEEFVKTDKAFELLGRDETEMKVNDVSFYLKVMNIKEMIQLIDKNEKIPLDVTLPDYNIEILGTIINFGPVKLYAPSFEIADKDNVLSIIQEKNDMDPIKIKVHPKDDIVKIKSNLSLKGI